MPNFVQILKSIQRTSSSTSTPPGRTFIQPKLVVGEVDDPLEHQADRMADQVMQKGPGLPLDAAPLHLSRKPQPTQSEPREVDGSVASEIQDLSGGGSSLPEPSRAFFESRFGHDFAAVRIHADSRSAELARSVDARAFTLGRDIVFGAGEYSPGTGEGARLLAHELTHVVQQQGAAPATLQRQPVKGGGAPSISNPAIDEVYDQLDIIREGQLPLEFHRRKDIRALSFVERQDMEFKRKWDAILRLGELRDQRAVLTLVAVLEDKISPIQGYSAEQQSLLKQSAAESLGKIGGKVSLSKLSGLLKSKDPQERKIAARALPGVAGGQAATDLLTALQAETDADLKAQIIFALGNAAVYVGNMKEKEAIAAELIRVMEKDKDTVRLAAVKALGKVRLKSATEPLLRLLANEHDVEPLAAEIVTALGEIGDQKAVDLVVIMLRVQVKKRVRIEAALALGKIGGTKARAALKERLNLETDADVREAIHKAMLPVLHWTFGPGQK
jgi:HEAT repeat protein